LCQKNKNKRDVSTCCVTKPTSIKQQDFKSPYEITMELCIGGKLALDL
jgi:hypothetical protein